MSIAALPIGQGDAILIRWSDGERCWSCLIDGGPSRTKLQQSLEAEGVDHLDLLVVTHVDADHIAGLSEWIDHDPGSFPEIDCYWGPALAAFERHRWLFPQRVAAGLDRGRKLEDALRDRNEDLEVVYPLEGFSAAPFGRAGPRLEVLNPPGRLIEQLLRSDDIGDLFAGETTPLGWLLDSAPEEGEEEEEEEEDQTRGRARWADGLAHRALDPDALDEILPSKWTEALDSKVASLAAVEPEFFGNKLLNNSSIVIWLDAPVDTRSYSVLLTGDLENWTYLVGRHRKGLQPDLLKAPHHGGRVYIEGVSGGAREAADALHRYLRPKAVLVSSIGGHGLPREATRNAWMRWGASVLCTCTRGRELLVGPPSADGCCNKNHDCAPRTTALKVLFEADQIVASQPACHSGFGDANSPPVIVHQQIVNPSPALAILGDLELRRGVNWLAKRLRGIHEERLTKGFGGTSEVVAAKDLRTMAAAGPRKTGPLPAHIDSILEVGMRRERVWSPPVHRHGNRVAYARPTAKELSGLCEALREIGMVSWPTLRAASSDRESMLLKLTHGGLENWARSRWGFPTDTFADLLLPTVLAELRRRDWAVLTRPAGGVLMVFGPEPKTRIAGLFTKLLIPVVSWQAEDWAVLARMKEALVGDGKAALQATFADAGNDCSYTLDGAIRSVLGELPLCGAWGFRRPLSLESGAELEGALLVAEEIESEGTLNMAIETLLKPTDAALRTAGFAPEYDYRDVLRAISRHREGWTERITKDGWSHQAMLLTFEPFRISSIGTDTLNRTVRSYADVVLASLDRRA